MFRLGYNTNGLAHHRLDDAIRLLADLGYEGLALTPDVGHLDPYRCSAREVESVRALCERLGLAVAVESGGRYLLDPRKKHAPTLLDDAGEARAVRVEFLERTVELAAELGAPLVSFWAGAAPCGTVADQRGESAGPSPHKEVLWQRLVDGVLGLLDHAEGLGIELAFEPEPGMFVERPAGYVELRARLADRGTSLGLCLDVGHLLVTGDRPEGEVVRHFADSIRHVHLDDIRGGRHEHLPFGRGELDLRGVMEALLDIGYRGMAAVELSRDSHRGSEAARESMDSLRAALRPNRTIKPEAKP